MAELPTWSHMGVHYQINIRDNKLPILLLNTFTSSFFVSFPFNLYTLQICHITECLTYKHLYPKTDWVKRLFAFGAYYNRII